MESDGKSAHQGEIQVLSELIAHPEMQRITDEILAAPESERLELVNKIATPEALAARGIPVPEGVKITTRYFEDPPTGAVVDGPEHGERLERYTQTMCFRFGAYTYGVTW